MHLSKEERDHLGDMESKRGEELCGGDSSEMDRGMYNHSMVIVYHTNDGLIAFVGDSHLEDPIKHNGKNTLVIQTNSDLDVMMLIKKPPAENSESTFGLL